MIFISHDDANTTYLIRSYQAGVININDQSYRSSLIVSRQKLFTDWAINSLETLDDTTLAPLIALEPEIIILGGGDNLCFPESGQLANIINLNIGYEIMTTAAACRTFNVLCSENRNVVAGLIIDTSSTLKSH